MKKSISIIVGLLVVTVFISIISVHAYSSNDEEILFASGNSSNNPIEIYTIEDLDDIRNDLNGSYVLMNDLDFNDDSSYADPGANKAGFTTGSGWNPIGIYDSEDPDLSFTGNFDCQRYKISNLFINRDDKSHIGLFGYISSTAKLFNFSLIDVDVNGNKFVGALIGLNRGSVSNCYSTGVLYGSSSTGGLIGDNWNSISDSYSTAKVTGIGNLIGGLTGRNDGSVTNCYSTGSVTGNIFVGGLIGHNEGSVSNSYAKGIVSGSSSTGGLIGNNDGSASNSFAKVGVNVTGNNAGGLVGRNKGYISDCYAIGSVMGNDNVGGLVGYNLSGSVSTSFYDNETSGESNKDTSIGKYTEDMKNITTFKRAGWDIEKIEDYENEIWFIDDGNEYPSLVFEYSFYVDNGHDPSEDDTKDTVKKDNDDTTETVDRNEDDTGTPGFTILILFLSIGFIFLVHKKRFN